MSMRVSTDEIDSLSVKPKPSACSIFVPKGHLLKKHCVGSGGSLVCEMKGRLEIICAMKEEAKCQYCDDVLCNTAYEKV